jgi:hypothetical protein
VRVIRPGYYYLSKKNKKHPNGRFMEDVSAQKYVFLQHYQCYPKHSNVAKPLERMKMEARLAHFLWLVIYRYRSRTNGSFISCVESIQGGPKQEK